MTENLLPIIDQHFLSGFLTEELFLLKQERNVPLEHENKQEGNENSIQKPAIDHDKYKNAPNALMSQGKEETVLKFNNEQYQSLNISEEIQKGNYAKKILILSNEVILENSAESILLEKIIEAIKLSWKDILLIQSPRTFELERIEKDYAPRLIISFGKRSTILNWPLQYADGEVFNIGRTFYLSSQNLTNLLDNRQEKMLLWKNLKTLFKIE